MAEKVDQKTLTSVLEKFLHLEEKACPSANEIERKSEDTYVMCDQKYLIKRKTKEEMLQYATLYFLRLEKLRPSVKDAAAMKWVNFEHLKFVENILDIKPQEETVIIGTLFKE